MKVLIVDDDALVAQSLSTILSVEDDVEVVGLGRSGPEAIAKARCATTSARSWPNWACATAPRWRSCTTAPRRPDSSAPTRRPMRRSPQEPPSAIEASLACATTWICDPRDRPLDREQKDFKRAKKRGPDV